MDAEVDWGMEDDFDPWQSAPASEKGQEASSVADPEPGHETRDPDQSMQEREDHSAMEQEKEEADAETKRPEPAAVLAKEDNSSTMIMPSNGDSPLPPDWITKTSRKDATKSYFYNTKTKEVSWTRPVPEVPEPETPPLPAATLPSASNEKDESDVARSLIVGEQSDSKEEETLDEHKASNDDRSVTSPAEQSSLESRKLPLHARISSDIDPRGSSGPMRNTNSRNSDRRSRQNSGRGDRRQQQGTSGRDQRGNRHDGRRPDSDRRIAADEPSRPPFVPNDVPQSGPTNGRRHEEDRTSSARRRSGPDDSFESQGPHKRPRVESTDVSTHPSIDIRTLTPSRSTTPPKLRNNHPADNGRRDQTNTNPVSQGSQPPPFITGVNMIPAKRWGPARDPPQEKIMEPAHETLRYSGRSMPQDDVPVFPRVRDTMEDRLGGRPQAPAMGRPRDEYATGPRNDRFDPRLDRSLPPRDVPPQREPLYSQSGPHERMPINRPRGPSPVGPDRFGRPDLDRLPPQHDERSGYNRATAPAVSRYDRPPPRGADMRNERPREYNDRRATEFSAYGRPNGPRSAELDSFRPVYDRPSARSPPPHMRREAIVPNGPGPYNAGRGPSGNPGRLEGPPAGSSSFPPTQPPRNGPGSQGSSSRPAPFVHPSRAQGLGVPPPSATMRHLPPNGSAPRSSHAAPTSRGPDLNRSMPVGPSRQQLDSPSFSVNAIPIGSGVRGPPSGPQAPMQRRGADRGDRDYGNRNSGANYRQRDER